MTPKTIRQYPRHEVALRVDYVDPCGQAGMGLATNLSYTGMYLTHTPRLRVGDMLIMVFALPTGTAYKLTARVIRTDNAGAGLCFTYGLKAYLTLSSEIN
jgi:PilZ domain